MEQVLETSMNIETTIFKKYKQYIKNKSNFNANVFNAVPKSLTVFPTITVVENVNNEDTRTTTLNRQETSNRLTYVIEIYAKDIVMNNKQISSKEIINELKYLTFNFFNQWGFTRTQATYTDYLNFEVSRYVINETCSLNNWNRKINI